MAMEILKHGDDRETLDTRDTLFMLGGISLLVFGAGLIATNPIVRRFLGQISLGSFAQAAMPDLERYLKIRAM
jgi:hypothetical protein